MNSPEQIKKEWRIRRLLLRAYMMVGLPIGLAVVLYIVPLVAWIKGQAPETKIIMLICFAFIVVATNLFCYRCSQCPSCGKLAHGMNPLNAWKNLVGLSPCSRCGAELG